MQFSSQLAYDFEIFSHPKSKIKSKVLSFSVANTHEAWLSSLGICFLTACLCSSTFSDLVCEFQQSIWPQPFQVKFHQRLLMEESWNIYHSTRTQIPSEYFDTRTFIFSASERGSKHQCICETNPQSRMQHNLCWTFLIHVWTAVGLISRLSKVCLVLSDQC